MNAPTIRRSRPLDLPIVQALLEEASLPTLGVADHFPQFFIAETSGRIVGAMGLEVYDETGLLRSAVVTPDHQKAGIGNMLFNSLLDQARGLGIRRLILLTNTAEKYFERRGFRRIEQKSVVGRVTGSVEFSGACPSHSACMELIL
jgi:amino-acid N-acetyltransferase